MNTPAGRGNDQPASYHISHLDDLDDPTHLPPFFSAGDVMAKAKQTAKPLADPDALVPSVPDHVQHPGTNPPNPVAVSTEQIRKQAKRRIKAAKRRLRS